MTGRLCRCWIAVTCLAAACAGQTGGDAAADTDAAGTAGTTPAVSPADDSGAGSQTDAAPAERVAGTPPGGLLDWVATIADGTDRMLGEMGTDVAAAQRRILDLYVTRQEFIEMYWGVAGRLRPVGADRLAQLVTDAESSFHEALQKLAVQPVDSAEIAAVADSINARLNRVVVEAKRLKVPLVPRAEAPESGGGGE